MYSLLFFSISFFVIPMTLLKASSKTWSLLTISLFQKRRVKFQSNYTNVAIFNCLQIHVDGGRTVSQVARKLLTIFLITVSFCPPSWYALSVCVYVRCYTSFYLHIITVSLSFDKSSLKQCDTIKLIPIFIVRVISLECHVYLATVSFKVHFIWFCCYLVKISSLSKGSELLYLYKCGYFHFLSF